MTVKCAFSSILAMRNLYHLALGSFKVTPAVKSSQAKAISSTLCAAELGNFSGGLCQDLSISQEPPEASMLALPSGLPETHLLGEEELS